MNQPDCNMPPKSSQRLEAAIASVQRGSDQIGLFWRPEEFELDANKAPKIMEFTYAQWRIFAENIATQQGIDLDLSVEQCKELYLAIMAKHPDHPTPTKATL